MSGGSKNGASPSVSLIHDNRLTALHASRSPIWYSPLRLGDEKAWEALNIADQSFAHRDGLDEKLTTRITQHRFRGGYFGPNLKPDAIAQGHSWETLKSLARQMADHVFISRNLADLHSRNVDLYFDPGTHDFVCFDVPWGGEHHPDIPIYLKTNSGHGKKRLHPALEKDEQNLSAFLLHHFFEGVDPLLEPPVLDYSKKGDSLMVTVRFKPGSKAESGRFWWMYDRGIEGSGAYLAEPFPDDQWKEMKSVDGKSAWTVKITLDASAAHIDFFSNHGKKIEYGGGSYPTYISSPYTRVSLR